MITLFYILIVLAIFKIFIGLVYNAEISFAPIFGVMVGSLYAYTDYEEGREHTLQVCIIFLSITVVWIET